MAYAYGMRFDDDSNAITVIDEDNQTAVTTGYIDGEYVEFGGGGGSSDFSTATITLINQGSEVYTAIPVATDNGINISNYPFPTGTNTYLMPLYKNRLAVFSSDDIIAEVSGSATYADGVLVVTGDCTITLR